VTDARRYTAMQQDHYENSDVPSEHVVGHYAWHEEFPYETLLLHDHGDLRHPVLPPERRRRALDFGCGPGRMIPRMAKFFDQVDGVDIAPRLLADARAVVPASTQLWATNGDDLGEAPQEAYDLVYCTVSFHHIAVWDVRMQILRHMQAALLPGGVVTLQLGYRDAYPWVPVPHATYWTDAPVAGTPRRRLAGRALERLGVQTLTSEGGRITGFYRADPAETALQLMRKDHQHASWRDNPYDATSTNSGMDATISAETLPQVAEDFRSVFGNFTCWFYDVSLAFADLRGASHPSDHWHTHWIFLHARRPVD